MAALSFSMLPRPHKQGQPQGPKKAPPPQFWGAGAAFALTLQLMTAVHASVAVQPVTANALRRAVASHKGHVVVLNFWATWCDGCVAEFPDLVAVGKTYRAKGVDFVTVSADTVRSIPAKVVPFLQKQGVTGTQYLQSPADIDTFTAAFDPHWQPAAYPSTYIYNRQGKLVKVLHTTVSRAELEAILKPLL